MIRYSSAGGFDILEHLTTKRTKQIIFYIDQIGSVHKTACID